MDVDAIRVHLGETGVLEIEQSRQELTRERIPIHSGGRGRSSHRRFDTGGVVDEGPQLEVEGGSPAPHHLEHRRGDLRDGEGLLRRDLA
jgi:hypothetical protein